MEKMTKRDYFSKLIEIVEGAEVANETELVEFLNRQIELVSKKRTAQTKTQKENEVLVEKVYEALVAIGRPVAVDELRNTDENMAVFSNQKLSALLKKLVDAGRVIKTVDKKKSYFSAE